jgi:CSLREA domain-containing protein
MSPGPFNLKTKRTACFMNAVLLLFLSLFFAGVEAKAATYIVNLNTDAKDINQGNGICDTNAATPGAQCTLRAAIQEANYFTGVDTISFALPTPNSITLTNGELEIQYSINIDGPGARSLTIQRGAGPRNLRVFTVTGSNQNVNISGVTIANGNSEDDLVSGGIGGGILLSDATLNLTGVNISNNVSQGSGGGIYKFGGTLNITRSTISNNQAGGSGGGIYNSGGIVNITNSTLSNNTAGDAVSDSGGGISNINGAVILTNVTVHGNAANTAGGIRNYSSGIFNVRNTIVAGNTDNSGYPDLVGAFTSQGNNLIGVANPGSGFTDGVNGDKTGFLGATLEPKLGALQNNGGQTDTHALLPSSPAIDSGDNCVALFVGCLNVSLLTDQRGASFSRQIDGDNNGTAIVDIGAFEATAPVWASMGDVKLSSATYSTSESNASIAVIVSRIGGSNGTITVNYSTSDGTATAGQDYTTTSGTLTFNNGESGKLITIPLIGDAADESDETFNITLSNPTGGATLLNPSAAVLTIVDNDSAASAEISGVVNYGITAGNQSPKAISGAVISAAGDSTSSATTDSAGNYSLNNLTTTGQFTVTPSKIGDVNGINTLDATRIQQHLVGLTNLTPNQLIAADTDGNGKVNSLDATRIQQYLVGIQSSNIIGQWKFVPGNKQYGSINSNLAGENYQAVLVGEVSGNWVAPASFAAEPETSETKEEILSNQTNQSEAAGRFENELHQQIAERMKQFADSQSNEFKFESSIAGVGVNVSLSLNASATSGSSITVPVTIGAGPAGSPIESFDFTVFYDPAVLQPASSSGSNTGTLSANCSVLSNSPQTGRVVVSGACATAITTASGGSLYNLNFNVIGTSGQQTGLLFNNPSIGTQTFMFNSGNSVANTTKGLFTVLPGPTAANVRVSGRVITALGRGIRNVQITMTDSQGNQQIVQTTAFGYYRFDNVTAGETVTITAKARRFRFNQSSIVRTTNDSVSNADFISEQ